jgi:hypothetical protein
MSATQTDVTGAITRSLPKGIAAGIGAYIASYVLLFVFLIVEGGDMLDRSAFEATGYILYNAHNVDITASMLGQSQSVNLLSTASGATTIPTIVYFVVPVVVLLGMGYLIGTLAQSGSDVVAAAGAGATITIGYLILAILGTFIFSTGGAGGSVGPDLLMSVLLFGLAYPIVFGAIGGAIAAVTN